jgi:hypothetical protein
MWGPKNIYIYIVDVSKHVCWSWAAELDALKDMLSNIDRMFTNTL